MADTRLSWSVLMSRWAVGMALVTWRYTWQTTVLHRLQVESPEVTPPPPLPDHVDRAGLLVPESGYGPWFNRTFRIRIADPALDARALMEGVVSDFGGMVPREVVRVRPLDGVEGSLQVGDDLVVDMPGPWNGPVRVISVDDHHLRFATLLGHLEAGQIEFRAHDSGAEVVFEIEAWARPSGRAVHLLYSRLRLAKEIQLNMWVRFCRSAAHRCRGRTPYGIEIETVSGPARAAVS